MAEDRNRVEVDVGLGAERAAATPDPEAAFAVLVLGDFGGRGGTELGGRRPVPFDRDDVDAAIARVAPSLTYAAPGGASVTVRFGALEDFHPDRLYETVSLFRSLRELRERLSDARTFASAARDVGGGEGERAQGGTASVAAALAGGRLLDRMLEESPAPSAGVATQREDDLAAFVRQVVQPHLVAREDPRQAEMVASVDAALAAQMRALLHDAALQSLEGAWRTVDFLARRIDTSAMLRLYLLDVPRAALDAALDGADGGLALARLLADAATVPEGGRWSALVGLYAFEFDDDDAVRVAQLGAIGRRLGAPWLAGAAPSFAGRDSWAALPDPRAWAVPASATWEAVRGTREASSVALVAPRFLLRGPYGQDGDAAEDFDFEEVDANPAHADFLWGNGAALCAVLLAESFASDGWAMRGGAAAEVRGLPLHVYRRDGEAVAVPCAETLLTERAAERLLELGVTPLASLRDTDSVRVVRLQSIASPPTRLAGAWSVAR